MVEHVSDASRTICSAEMDGYWAIARWIRRLWRIVSTCGRPMRGALLPDFCLLYRLVSLGESPLRHLHVPQIARLLSPASWTAAIRVLLWGEYCFPIVIWVAS